MLKHIRTFARWNAARRREAEAVLWDETAERLAISRIRNATAAGLCSDPVMRHVLIMVAHHYQQAERSARELAKTIREGR